MSKTKAIEFFLPVFITIITAALAYCGYTAQEKYKLRSSAYSQYLAAIQDPDKSYSDVRTAYSNFYMYASDCAIEEVSDNMNFVNGVPQGDDNTIRKISLILHNDLSRFFCVPKPLTLDYIFLPAERFFKSPPQGFKK